MERKFRIIEKCSYNNVYTEQKTYYVQEWERGFFGKWKWRYWQEGFCDTTQDRKFKTLHEAKEIINKYVEQQPYKKVIEEITF